MANLFDPDRYQMALKAEQTDPTVDLPELKLVKSVLAQGILHACYANGGDLEWIFLERERRPFSFSWCCQYAGLDPERLRERLKAHIRAEMRKKRPGRIRHLTGMVAEALA